jgi:stearoyl-CoA desaturase (delta-9 desaturase)
MKFGYNFWLIFLPFHILGLFGLYFAPTHLLELFTLWFIIGVMGNGVAAHRYFAHGQFQTYKPIRWMLGFLATLGAIGPVTNWPIQHKAHHLSADSELDPHSPNVSSAWYVFYAWTFPQGKNQKRYMQHRWVKKLIVSQMRDPMFRFFHYNHYKIIYTFCVILFLINPIWLLLYCLAYCIDFLRLGSVNYWCHKSGYRNHDTGDKSTNNIWLGWLGMGFGWHNNHHAHVGKLILHERWWEIDIEGYIGYLLAKR